MGTTEGHHVADDPAPAKETPQLRRPETGLFMTPGASIPPRCERCGHTVSAEGACVRCASAAILRADAMTSEPDEVIAKAAQAALGDWSSDRGLSPDVQDQLLRWREKREEATPRRRAPSAEHHAARKKTPSAQAQGGLVALPSTSVALGPDEPASAKPRAAMRVVAPTVEVTSRAVPVFSLPGDEEPAERGSLLGKALLWLFIAASATGVVFGLATNL